MEGQERTEKDKERTREYRERGVRKKGKKCEHKDEYQCNPASSWTKTGKFFIFVELDYNILEIHI